MFRLLKPTLALVVVLAATGAACATTSSGGPIPPLPSPSVGKLLADVISPGLEHNYVFQNGTPPVDIQPGSKKLLAMIPAHNGLHVFALQSTKDSSAILLIEDNPKLAWGTLLHPAERVLFEKFAANPKMGDWLMVLDDVVVPGPKDPVPLTAYRWPRADVEQYVACGIPKTLQQNDCSRRFYLQAVTIILAKTRQHLSH